jgi:hypothetical protein
MPEVSAGVTLDWNSKPVKIIQVQTVAAEAGLASWRSSCGVTETKIVEPLSLSKSSVINNPETILL